jgi:hypothetical protein
MDLTQYLTDERYIDEESKSDAPMICRYTATEKVHMGSGQVKAIRYISLQNWTPQ